MIQATPFCPPADFHSVLKSYKETFGNREHCSVSMQLSGFWLCSNLFALAVLRKALLQQTRQVHCTTIILNHCYIGLDLDRWFMMEEFSKTILIKIPNSSLSPPILPLVHWHQFLVFGYSFYEITTLLLSQTTNRRTLNCEFPFSHKAPQAKSPLIQVHTLPGWPSLA